MWKYVTHDTEFKSIAIIKLYQLLISKFQAYPSPNLVMYVHSCHFFLYKLQMPHGGAIDINFIQKAYHGVHKMWTNTVYHLFYVKNIYCCR